MESSDKNINSIAAAAVFILALIVFLPILGNGFVNWDDPLYVYENLHIRSLDIKWIFTSVVASNYHPLTMLSHTIDYAVFGLNAAGHHFSSILLHGLNSALVFILAKKIFYRAGLAGENKRGLCTPALAAALLFVVHPLHVESVAWVSERKDVLSTFFFLLAILTYLGYAEGAQKVLLYCLALLFFILALLSKPMAVTLPAVLLLLDYYPLKRWDKGRGWRRIIIEKIPFFALSLASVFVTLWAQHAGGALRDLETHSLAKRLYIAARSVTFYLQKIILPTDLSPYYPLPFSTSLFSAAFIGSLIIILVITLLCLLAIKRGKKWPICLWLFYLITLLPVSGLITVGGQAAADRYAYIPTMGFFLLFGAIIGRVAAGRKGEAAGTLKSGPGAAAALLIVVLIILTTATVKQERIWRNTVTLMSRAIKLYPNRAAIPYNNRGLAYERADKLQLALADYNKAAAISPEFTETYINRGIVYGRSSRYREAIEDFSRAIAIDAASPKAYINRGAAYLSLGNYALALRDLKRAVVLDPLNGAAAFNLGLVYLRLGHRAEAYKSMERALGLGIPEAGEFVQKRGMAGGEKGTR